eukprot:3369573-Karenia_brevis.AAC.1
MTTQNVLKGINPITAENARSKWPLEPFVGQPSSKTSLHQNSEDKFAKFGSKIESIRKIGDGQ